MKKLAVRLVVLSLAAYGAATLYLKSQESKDAADVDVPDPVLS